MWAIVPAAGLGRRFKRGTRNAERGSDSSPPKQLADIGDRAMLAAVLDALDVSGVVGVIVVVNPLIRETIRTQRPETTRRIYVVNDRPDSEMIESIQLGLQNIPRDPLSPSPSLPLSPSGCLICPGDHPCITPAAINECIEGFVQDPSRIVIASHAGRRGHPIVLPGDIVFDVLSWPPSRGLNEVRTLHADRVKIVEVDEPGILIDVDTPEDLQRARDFLDETGRASAGFSCGLESRLKPGSRVKDKRRFPPAKAGGKD